MKFEQFTVPRIVFGRGQVERLAEIAKPMGSAALLVHNAPPLLERVGGLLSSAGIGCTPIEQRGEPKVTDVDKALDLARSSGIDFVIGVGGGSAIDTAKAVAGLLGNGGSALDYMEVVGKGQKIAKPALPWIAIPTTAGTGAEATRNAVIGYPEKQFKASIRSEHLLARVALVDPELGMPVPPEVTASSGMDALCQLIESYTSTGAQPMTDALAIEGTRAAARSLQRAYHNGADIEAREGMALAALFSGITLANAGLGAVHGFAAPLGANFPVPHGTVCAALLPPVIEANVEAMRALDSSHPVLRRYATIGREIAEASGSRETDAIDYLVRFTSGLLRSLRIPPLSNYGMTESDIPPMVALARKASSMRYNPVVLSDEALAAILRKGITGTE